MPFESIFTKKPYVATGCKLQVKRGGWKLQGNWGCTCAGCYRPEDHPCTRMSGQGLGQVLGPSSSIMDIFVSRKNNREWVTIMSPGSITAIHDLNVYLVNPLSHRSNCLPEMETSTWRDQAVPRSREPRSWTILWWQKLKVVNTVLDGTVMWRGTTWLAGLKSKWQSQWNKKLNLMLWFLFNPARLDRWFCLERPVCCIYLMLCAVKILFL